MSNKAPPGRSKATTQHASHPAAVARLPQLPLLHDVKARSGPQMHTGPRSDRTRRAARVGGAAASFTPRSARELTQQRTTPRVVTRVPPATNPNSSAQELMKPEHCAGALRVDPPKGMPCAPRHPPPTPQASDTKLKTHREKLLDYSTLAEACRRAGRIRGEAVALFNMGVCNDNMGLYQDAIVCYRKFLGICIEAEDEEAQCLAYNALAADYLLLDANRYFDEALLCNVRHRDGSNEASSRFVAHTNLGLLFLSRACHEKESASKTRFYSQAAANFQQSLRYAIHMGLPFAQSVAIVNIGITAFWQKDFITAHACMERYLQLCPKSDLEAQARAHRNLGIVAFYQGDNEESLELLNQAMKAEACRGNKAGESMCKVLCGVVRGKSREQEFMDAFHSGTLALRCA